MKYSWIFWIFALVLVPHLARGQSVERIGVEGQYGFIIPHASDLVSVSQSSPIGFTLDYQRMDLSENSWLSCNCFNYLGLQFAYHNFNNQEVLGAAYSLSGTFEPILIQKNNFEFSLKSGMGITFLSKVYNAETNPTNIFFSSPVSFLLFVSPKVSYAPSEQWSLSAAFNYNHISNGGQRKPNRGMNYPAFGIGMAYYFQEPDFPQYNRRDSDKHWQWYLEGGITHRNADWTTGRKVTLNLAAGALKPISTINALGGGMELTKDFALEVEKSRWEALMPAPYFAHHFVFGKFDFSQRFARYTQKPRGYVDNRFYQRYIVQYKVRSNLHLGISLKAHGHVAENLDFRLGWRF